MGPDSPCHLLVCTYHLVDVVREYGHVLVRSLATLMATLASDPVGQELFECCYYEDVYSACSAVVENPSDGSFHTVRLGSRNKNCLYFLMFLSLLHRLKDIHEK